MDNKFNIIVVGGGMIGLATTLGLLQKGLKVALIESKNYDFLNNKDFSKYDKTKKVSAINKNSENFLNKLEVFQNIIPFATNYFNMEVWNENSFIKMLASDVNETELGFIIENNVIIKCLYEKIKNLGGEIFTNSKISKIVFENENHNIFLENNTNILTNLIIGADGANSFIRKYFNFDIKEKTYNQTALITNVLCEKEHNCTAYQKFTKYGALAFLPMQNKNMCSIVWSINNDKIDYILNLNNKEFNEKLSFEFDFKLGKVESISKIFSFPLIERHTKKYYKNKVVLIGDACHTIHPLAGQGANLGFKDAESLIKLVSENYYKKRDFSHFSVLEEYEYSRKFDNEKMIFVMRALKDLFNFENNIISLIRDFGLKKVNDNNYLKKQFIKKAMGV